MASLWAQLEDIPTVMIWHRESTYIPFLGVAAYLTFLRLGQQYMEKRPAFTLKGPFIFWNFVLALFSIMGTYYVVPITVKTFVEKGFRYTLCASPFTWSAHPPHGIWMLFFIYSKFAELIDTVFLVLKKRQVVFLHWYHHVTVLLFCWHAWYTVVGYGIWFGAVNYSVHALMYSYYFATSIGLRKYVSPLAPIITGLQIVQMVFGMFALLEVAWIMSGLERESGSPFNADPKEEGIGYQACYVDRTNLLLGLLMYFSYFLLFAQYFAGKYCSGEQEVVEKKTEKDKEM